MNKISVFMYSTFAGNSYKGHTLNSLTKLLIEANLLEYSYGLADKADQYLNDSQKKKIVTSRILRFMCRMNRKLFNILPIHSYYGYLINEQLYGCFARFKIKKSSSILYLKPKPYCLHMSAKKKKKYTIVECSENHPEYTASVLKEECELYGITKPSIYLDTYSIQNAKKSLELADELICLSQFSAKTYVDKGISPNKITIINLGISEETPKLNIKKKQEIVFFCTAYHSILKGTHRLIEIWNENNIKNKLYIIGGLHDDMKEFIKKTGIINKNIIFIQHLEKKELYELYQSYIGYGILCSFSDSYGRSVIEFLCNGLPVIVSPCCTCDCVIDKKNGFIVNPKNKKQLLSQIQRAIFLTDKEYENLSKEAYKAGNLQRNIFSKKLTKHMESIGDDQWKIF